MTMEERMIFAGFGGQGLLTAGKLLAESAMREGKYVTYFPSYGGEVRRANSTRSSTVPSFWRPAD